MLASGIGRLGLSIVMSKASKNAKRPREMSEVEILRRRNAELEDENAKLKVEKATLEDEKTKLLGTIESKKRVIKKRDEEINELQLEIDRLENEKNGGPTWDYPPA